MLSSLGNPMFRRFVVLAPRVIHLNRQASVRAVGRIQLCGGPLWRTFSAQPSAKKTLIEPADMDFRKHQPPDVAPNTRPDADAVKQALNGLKPGDEEAGKEAAAPVKISTAGKLRALAAQYGSTVMVFHVSLSLTWLGLTYWALTLGVDVHHYLEAWGVLAPDSGAAVAGAGTFVVAYACYKVFAPVRMAITAATVPFIVRYLRKVGLLRRVA